MEPVYEVSGLVVCSYDLLTDGKSQIVKFFHSIYVSPNLILCRISSFLMIGCLNLESDELKITMVVFL